MTAVVQPDMTTGRVRPFECLREGTDLLRGHYWLLVGVCALGTLLGSLAPLGLLLGPMMCGIYLCFFRRLRGEPVPFELLFRGFDYFVESMLATLVLIGASLVLITPAVVLMFVAGVIGAASADRHGGGALVSLAVVVVAAACLLTLAFALGQFFLFVYPLIVDRRLKAMPAIATSFRAVWANFWGVAGVLLLTSCISFAAVLLCYFPAFLVLPICFGANVVAYRRVFPAAAGVGG